MAEELKKGQKDLCVHCGRPIVWDAPRFWKDTKEIVPKGPDYIYIPGHRTPTEAEKAKAAAYDNWVEYVKQRGTIDWSDQDKVYHYGETWLHIMNTPIEKLADLARRCPGGKTFQTATPSSFCNEVKNAGGTCYKKAKEIVKDSFEGKKALCGIHLAHLRKAVREAEARDQAAELEAWKAEELDKKITELKELGIDADKEWLQSPPSYRRHYTGKVTVDPDQLLEILQSIVEVF